MPVYDRMYHGVRTEPGSLPGTITVEAPANDAHRSLYQLYAADDFGDHFSWGYHGDGPQRAAAALLCDALALDDPRTMGMAVGDKTLPWVLLRDEFVSDIIEPACDEWRITRPMILRWCRAWFLQSGISDLPAELERLPELTADPEIYKPLDTA